MQIKLNNSNIVLLLPRGYGQVDNGEALYGDMYHVRKANDIQMFQNIAARSYGNTVISHISREEAMPFDKEALISQIHANLSDNQGLIEVETGKNPRGFEYVYSIIKTYHQDWLNVNYCLRMNIINGDEIIDVTGSFFEIIMTGERSAMGWNFAMNAGFERDQNNKGELTQIKGWAEDPYDPSFTRGCRMIMPERPGLDGLFPDDPLSQARELVLALTEDSYYKTRDEIEAESKKDTSNKGKKAEKELTDSTEKSEEDKEDPREVYKMLFSKDVSRNGAYKIEIADNQENKGKFVIKLPDIKAIDLSKTAALAKDGIKSAVSKTASELDKVKTPFEIPDDFRCKLNKPMPKELPGWGKRQYIGFGKHSFATRALIMSWPVTETESLPLGDEEGIINQFHQEGNENLGLIAAKCGLTPKGNRYAYTIRKMMFFDEEGNPQGPMDYELNFNIRVNGKIHFMNGSFQPEENLEGIRGSALGIMERGSCELRLNAEHWVRDPYDEAYKKGLLMTWEEDEKFDGLFPYHPLSEMRRFVKYVIENN
ncbi:hypothetical protein [Butyrivibrio sp. JL13D10]|uniref:hypothetical protein n=1 Tax=Butyrivibrio sp. JL13D10 TaxID=3236815 RepID=UPI0038B53490